MERELERRISEMDMRFCQCLGGKLYIGMDDNGKVVGVDNVKKLSEDIPNQVRDVLGIMVDVNILEENGLEYLEIDVPAYSNPINYKGQYHYRSGSTKQELKGAALNRFILQRTGKNWDEVPMAGVSIDDLSKDALNRFRKEAAKSNQRIGLLQDCLKSIHRNHTIHLLQIRCSDVVILKVGDVAINALWML